MQFPAPVSGLNEVAYGNYSYGEIGLALLAFFMLISIINWIRRARMVR